MYILKCRLCNNSNLFTILAPYTCDCFISMYSFMAIVGIMRYLSKEQEWAALGAAPCCLLRTRTIRHSRGRRRRSTSSRRRRRSRRRAAATAGHSVHQKSVRLTFGCGVARLSGPRGMSTRCKSRRFVSSVLTKREFYIRFTSKTV